MASDMNQRKALLESMGVHEVRNVARMWNVPSPTSKFKTDLIDLILRAMAGDTSFMHEKKAGRPAKSLFIPHNFEEFDLPKNFQELIDERELNKSTFENALEFNQDLLPDSDFNLTSANGYLNKYKNIFYIANEDNNTSIFVSNLFVVQNNLEIGDYLSILANTKDNINFATREVLSVNGTPVKELNRHPCDFKEIVDKSDAFLSGSFKEGGKFYVSDNRNFENLEKNKENITAFANNGFKVVIVGIKLEVDTVLKIRKILGTDNIKFISYFEDSPTASYETILNAIHNTTIRARNGEKLLVLVVQIDQMIKELNTYFAVKNDAKQEENYYGTINLVRKLLGMNRCLKSGGSITIISSNPTGQFNENFLK